MVPYFVVVVIVKTATDVVNVTEGQSLSLNCTISGDGSYTWERRDGTEIENAKRKVTLSSLFSIHLYLLLSFIFHTKRKMFESIKVLKIRSACSE